MDYRPDDLAAGTTFGRGIPKKQACQLCRVRKIKCDGGKPVCGTCIAHTRECEYEAGGTKRRSRVAGSRRDEQDRRRRLTSDSCESSEQMLDYRSNQLALPSTSPEARRTAPDVVFRPANQTELETQAGLDVREHLATDTRGNVEVRGPTNTLYEFNHTRNTNTPQIPDAYASAILTSNAAVERQKEAEHKEYLLEKGDIEGVPAELALHLLDVHWSRHHFFLLTYRPAFYRDMVCGGPYYSPLLLYAILAVSSRYSERHEVGGGDHSATSGVAFYKKAKELLVEEMDKSTIPTATSLLLMGNALVAAGEVDRGWLYTGMGLRMIFNLGLHLDVNEASHLQSTTPSLEDVEIGRRVFWGAYVSEKLQSLYLGRPFYIHSEDVHVPKKFLDVYEEAETWQPVPASEKTLSVMATNSVSVFTAQCKLSEICGEIMSSFYAVKAKTKSKSWLNNARDGVRERLSIWLSELPDKLIFTPWTKGRRVVPIHVIVLHTVYLSLVILLERPFVADGHLVSNAENVGSWVECTVAAEKIAHMLHAYRESYTFRRIAYQLCYTTYVASTVLVRNANNSSHNSTSVQHLVVCLKAFEEMKLAHPGAARMQSVIYNLMTRLGVDVKNSLETFGYTPPDINNSPISNFEAYSSSVMENRNIDFETIKQSFSMMPSNRIHPPLSGNSSIEPVGATNVGNFQPQLNPLQAYDSLPSYNDGNGIANDTSEINWNFVGEGFNDDILFGVLSDNWASM